MSPFPKSWSLGGRRKGSADAEHNAHTIALPKSSSSSNSSSESLRSHSPKSRYETPDLSAQVAAHQHRDDLITQFWGGKPEKKSKPSRASPPPAYMEAETLPAYPEVASEDSVEQAKWLWKNGFRGCALSVDSFRRKLTDALDLVFPPFWIVGIVILCTSLRVEESWHPDKTDAERRQLVIATRQEEMKYGWRCLWAFLTFLVLVTAVLAIVIVAMK
jgi:hypothetical protein